MTFGDPFPQNDHVGIGRIDFQQSAKNTIFGRYLVEHVFVPPSFDLNHNLLSVQGNASVGSDGLAQAFTIGNTYLFGSNIVNAARNLLLRNPISATRTFSNMESSPGHLVSLTCIGITADGRDMSHPYT